MIDRRAINILYNDQVGKKLVEDFYQLLVVYSGALNNRVL